MYRLVILTGARKGHRLVVQKGNLLIGRAPDVQLDLRDDDTVSHHHAVIEDGADGYYLREMGGLNPPEVNGQPVRGVLKLKADDQIEIGRTLMQFQVPTTPPRRPTGVPPDSSIGLPSPCSACC
jgi:predicted component of type VI protein secretion system